ncbi:hypothetical protein [Azohydromonas sediminis]|uniref:hypothetical protein n=1 Tax=Azohydromonas sediminis TaxID=2259674 RepID=UPI000E65A14B|nr:hypothetical protein [Azohydromonas sediminis]
MANPSGSIKVRPTSIVFDQAQTFVPFPNDPTRQSFNTTWTTANTFVEVYFLNGVPTGTVQVHGDVPKDLNSGFSSNGTGNNDFVMYYSDGFINLAEREPLDYIAYNLLGVGDYGATRQNRNNPIPNTVAGGYVTLVEVQQVPATATGPIPFFGGAGGSSSAGISIDFPDNGYLQVSVNPAASVSASDLFVFNTISTSLQAWDIEVNGTLNGESKIYIPYGSAVTDPSLLKVFHFDEQLGRWELLPTTVDTTNKWLIATTDSFSPIAVAQVPSEDAATAALRQLNASRDLPTPGTLLLTGCALLLVGWSRSIRSSRPATN